MLCNNCGEENSKGKFCCECGHSLLDSKIYNSDIEEVEKEYIQSEAQIEEQVYEVDENIEESLEYLQEEEKIDNNLIVHEEEVHSESDEIPIEAQVNIEEIFTEPILKEEETFVHVQIKEVESYVDLSEEGNEEEILVELNEDIKDSHDELEEIKEEVFSEMKNKSNIESIEESIEDKFDTEEEYEKVKLQVEDLDDNTKLLIESESVISKLEKVFDEAKEDEEKLDDDVKIEDNLSDDLIVSEESIPEKVKKESIEEDKKKVEPINKIKKTNTTLKKEKLNNKNKAKKKLKKDSKKNSKYEVIKKLRDNKKIIVIGSIVAVVTIIGGMSFNTIKANYYLNKMNSSTLQVEKVQYAARAVQASNNSKTISALETALENTIETNIKVVDNKLDEMSTILPEEDYKTLAEKIKNLEVNYYCDNDDYKDAITQLGKINDLGANFKKNINYADMMLYSINNLIDSSVKKVDSVIDGKESTIVKENIDDDNFEEILNIEKGTSNGEIKINLFKYVDSAYTSVNTYSISNSLYNSIISTEIYNYNTNEPAIYLQYKDSSNNIIVYVIDVENSEIKLRNSVKCGKYAFIEDIDNDGRYEIGSSASSSKVDTWYKLNEDGTTSVLDINNENSDSSTTTNTNTNTEATSVKDSSYIFEDSNSRYLTDSDVSGLSKSQLSLARNEIFARYGYVFSSKEYIDYFNKKSWYKANSSYSCGNETLNNYERANVELLKKWEES